MHGLKQPYYTFWYGVFVYAECTVRPYKLCKQTLLHVHVIYGDVMLQLSIHTQQTLELQVHAG